MVTAEELTFTDSAGVEVFYRVWPCAGRRATVVVAHGASEHSGRYARFAEALVAAGYEVLALDHRGHGRTGEAAGPTGPGRLGPTTGETGEPLVDDLGHLVRLVAGRGGAPVFLFGHSMGSMIAQAYATRGAEGLAGYILSGPVGVLDGGAALQAALQDMADGGMADEMLDMLGPFNESFEPARTPFDWLSRDEAEVDAYLADRYCGPKNPLTYGFVAAMLDLAVRSAEPEAIAAIPSIPVLLVAGDRDPVGNFGVGVRRLEERLRAHGLDVTAHYYVDARHEVLNDVHRDQVTTDIIDWLGRAMPRPERSDGGLRP